MAFADGDRRAVGGDLAHEVGDLVAVEAHCEHGVGAIGTRRLGHDHDQSLAWEEADHHCRGLSLNERRDWRLPEIGELEALYNQRFDEPCGDRTCHLDPALRLAGPYVWSTSMRGPGTRFYSDFSFASSFSPGIGPTLVRRVLCVRTRDASRTSVDQPVGPP